jgi:cellulose/xylan binding protein with CBM9 domain
LDAAAAIAPEEYLMSRKTKLILLCLTAFLSGWAAHGQIMNTDNTYTSNITISSKYSDYDFTPDGDLNKNAWRRGKWMQFDHDMSGQHNHPQAETRVMSCWTAAYVYFAFQCKYSTLNVYEGEDTVKERWELWNRDVAEVFINPDPSRVTHYYEFEVAPNNQWIDLEIDKTKTPFNDAAWDSHFDHATRIDAKKHIWTCEMRIPISSLKALAIQPGTEWRVNFFRADGPGDDSKRRFMSWSTIPEGNTFHVPTRFGIIKFLK